MSGEPFSFHVRSRPVLWGTTDCPRSDFRWPKSVSATRHVVNFAICLKQISFRLNLCPNNPQHLPSKSIIIFNDLQRCAQFLSTGARLFALDGDSLLTRAGSHQVQRIRMREFERTMTRQSDNGGRASTGTASVRSSACAPTCARRLS
jgi:hypothetical protein